MKIIVTQNTLRFHLTGLSRQVPLGGLLQKLLMFSQTTESEALPGSCASNGTGVDCRCGFGKSD